MENKRIFQYDFMRVIFMLMVLGVHVISHLKYFVKEYNTTWYIVTIITDILMISNPLFFMLSGKFNLDKNFSKPEDYKKYYKKKFTSILLPFIIVSIILYILKSYSNLKLIDYLKQLLAGNISGTHWFVYTLIAILIFSPFFSKMFKNMSLIEKKIFLLVDFLMNAFVVIFSFFNIDNYTTFLLLGIASWHFYYFAGYMIEDIFNTKMSRNILIVLGFIALLLQLYIRRFMKFNYRLTDPSPLLTLEAFGLYFLLLDKIKIRSEIIQKVIAFIAKYSFTFYMLHSFFVEKTAQFFNLKISSLNNFKYGIYIFIISFLVTLTISILIDNVLINTIKKFEKC